MMSPEEFTRARSLALAQGASETQAEVFAVHYLTELEAVRKAEEDDEEEEKSPEEWVLEYSLKFLNKYRQKLAAGHSELWARTYADSIEKEDVSQKNAYDALRQSDPRRGTEGAVYQEAYGVRMRQGDDPEYAAMYAKFIAEDSFWTAEPYMKAYTEKRKAGHSVLYAKEYALLIGSDNAPAAAAMAAGFYERALGDGLPERHARMYADHLSEALYGRTSDLADQVFHTLRVEGYIAGHRYASDNRLVDPNAFAENASIAYLNALGDTNTELPPTGVRRLTQEQAVQLVVHQRGTGM